MANLPPKPLDPPSMQRQERRNDNYDNHSARSSQSRGRERPLSSNDRFYVPRRSDYDSYAPGYDRRRDDDSRRRDYIDRERDRGRAVWERNGDIRDRDRGSRFVEPDPDNRDRRGYRERGYDRGSARYSPQDRHRDSYDRRDHRPSSPIRPGMSNDILRKLFLVLTSRPQMCIVLHPGPLREDDLFHLHRTALKRVHALTVARHLPNE